MKTLLSSRLAISFLFLLPLLLRAADPAPADFGVRPEPHLFYFQAVYVRENTDRDWQIRISGEVPSLPGCYLIVHDAEGRLLVQRHIPHGKRSPEEAVKITVPADGLTGDCRIMIVGFQDDTLLLDLPLTDLPLEVYGRTHFAARQPHGPLRFRVAGELQEITFTAHMSGNLRIVEGTNTVFDLREEGKPAKRARAGTVKLQPGLDYELQPYATFYFGAKQPVFFSFDLRRWFQPNPKLEEVKWWHLKSE